MKRNLFNTLVVFCLYSLFYKLGFFSFFFVEGDGQSVFFGLVILAGCFLVASSLLHFLLDHWIKYEQILEFVIKEKKVVEIPLAPSSTNTDGSPILSVPDPNLCGHEYIFRFSRRGSPEEEFEKEVCEKVFNSFSEGDIIHVHKKRTIVATHYTVVREKSLGNNPEIGPYNKTLMFKSGFCLQIKLLKI